jgi:hypothetical protein
MQATRKGLEDMKKHNVKANDVCKRLLARVYAELNNEKACFEFLEGTVPTTQACTLLINSFATNGNLMVALLYWLT